MAVSPGASAGAVLVALGPGVVLAASGPAPPLLWLRRGGVGAHGEGDDLGAEQPLCVEGCSPVHSGGGGVLPMSHGVGNLFVVRATHGL